MKMESLFIEQRYWYMVIVNYLSENTELSYPEEATKEILAGDVELINDYVDNNIAWPIYRWNEIKAIVEDKS